MPRSWLFGHQIPVLQRQIKRPRFTPTDRTVLAILSPAFDQRHLKHGDADRETGKVIGLHHRLLARHWTQTPIPRTGRPPTPPEPRRLVLRLDVKNPNWGLPAHPRRDAPS